MRILTLVVYRLPFIVWSFLASQTDTVGGSKHSRSRQLEATGKVAGGFCRGEKYSEISTHLDELKTLLTQECSRDVQTPIKDSSG